MKHLWVAYIILLAATILLRPDNTGVEPPGIVALELATTETFANVIIGGWSDAGLKAAKRLQSQDDPWVPIYSVTLATGCIMAGGKWGRRLMLGSLIAGFCDLIENRAINQMLNGQSMQPWPAISAFFAAIKFILIIAAIVYTLKSGFSWARGKMARAVA